MTGETHFSIKDRKAAARAFDFIDRIRGITAIEELKAAFAIEADAFGFQYFTFGRVNPSKSELQKTPLNTLPEGWYQHYIDRGYVTHDPAALAVVSNTLPFTWQGLQERGNISDANQLIFDEAGEWQMHDGLCIPMHSPDGPQAFATLAGLMPDMSEGARGAMHLMAIYTDAKALELSDWSLKRIRPPSQLTPRERECTIWIAAGKSTWDIGQILGLSEQTVASYIKSAMHKLNVVTRAQLVADALRLGEIAM